jgi:streptogramin lyase
MTIGPDGAHWFTDPGTESVSRIDANGTVTEYPLPELPRVAQGYEHDAYGTPAAITTVSSELWVASSSGEGMYSINPNGVARATTARRHQHRRHRR